MLPEKNINNHHGIDVDAMLSHWLSERNKLLVMLYKLSGIKPYTIHNTRPSVGAFCQRLVDYLSLSHFQIFENLGHDAHISPKNQKKYEQIYQQLTDTAEGIMRFYDSYHAAYTVKNDKTLARELSQLSELLAARIELEDDFIRLLVRKSA